MKWPRIRARRTTEVSPWMSIIAREVEFARGEPPQTYHAVEQADYIAIVALTRGGKIAIVRQYRPALEAFAWELPAGLVDPGEAPAECCRRELLEETGLTARAIHALGGKSPLHRPAQQPHSFVLRRGRRTYRRLQAGAGRRGEAGVAGGDRPPDQGRQFRFAAPHRRAVARGIARVSRPAQDKGETTAGAEAVSPMTAHPACATCGRVLARAPRSRDAWRHVPRTPETVGARSPSLRH
jgi:8-oxo-dGTP pyrophosphatase MutT (NUDIX family)